MVKISSDRRFEFGKYNGHHVSEIIRKDPQYIEYLSNKIGWIFTEREKRDLRNLLSRKKNNDFYSENLKYRTPFEEEMYRLANKNKKWIY